MSTDRVAPEEEYFPFDPADSSPSYWPELFEPWTAQVHRYAKIPSHPDSYLPYLRSEATNVALLAGVAMQRGLYPVLEYESTRSQDQKVRRASVDLLIRDDQGANDAYEAKIVHNSLNGPESFIGYVKGSLMAARDQARALDDEYTSRYALVFVVPLLRGSVAREKARSLVERLYGDIHDFCKHENEKRRNRVSSLMWCFPHEISDSDEGWDSNNDPGSGHYVGVAVLLSEVRENKLSP